MAKRKTSQFTFHRELIQQLVTLSTSAFGLAAALAWNETIQATVKEFIDPKLPFSGIISRFVYAIIVTALGILVTFQLSRLAQKWGIKK